MKPYRVVLLVLLTAGTVLAGPPFRTDDPVPIDYHHAEAYLFSTGTHDAGGTGGIGPAVEFNYGILPDTMFHIVAPMAYDSPKGSSSHFGYGDTEIGVKHCFVHEGDGVPMIGVFPLAEVPTGDENKGLGNGEAQYFLPIWLQKDFGKWTTYGGGGYWINPGRGNRNYSFSGILLQYDFSEQCYLGGEVFHQTADTADGQGSNGFNLGGSLPLVDDFQLLYSVGRGLKNVSSNRFSYYISFYRAF